MTATLVKSIAEQRFAAVTRDSAMLGTQCDKNEMGE